jgi:hypothetical protein
VGVHALRGIAPAGRSDRSPLHDVRQHDSIGPHGLMESKDVAYGRAKIPAGGARRDRTDDLLLAKQALSQLSYGPSGEQNSDVSHQETRRRPDYRPLITEVWIMVGLGRFELPTSRLSSARSNQLSYKPAPGASHQHAAISRRLTTDS